MNRLKLFLTVLLGVILSTGFPGGLFAQDVDVLVTPEEADIQIGEGIQLEVFAYSINQNDRKPIDADQIEWLVEPDSMGTITDDGFFIAGRHAGDAIIVIKIRIGNHVFHKRVVIRIGRIINHFFKIEVVPERAVVPAGSEQKFRVVLKRGDIVIPPRFVRWEVKPEELGKISADGVFAAGNLEGYGQVIAHVEIDDLHLRAAAHVVVSPAANSIIAGTILNDADNTPIPNAVVRAVRLGAIPWIQKAWTDSSGNYTLADLIPGVYVLHADARGFIGEFYNNTRNYLEAQPLNIAGEDTITGVDFGLSAGGKINGAVLAEADSSALPGAHVVAFLVVNPRYAKHVITGEDGSYSIESLPTGSYAVRADAIGYKGEYYDDSPEFSGAEFVVVEEPETVENIDFALATASAISGEVTSAADGTPIAGAQVKVFGLMNTAAHDFLFDTRRILLQTRTDENGKYVIPARPGVYFVEASAEGFNSEFYDDARNLAEATLVPVKPDSHTTNIDFALAKRSSIAGSVTDQNTGEPIAGAVVEAFKERTNIDPAATNAGFRAKTDSSGNYLIENVPNGKYILVANARGYLSEFYEEAKAKNDAKIILVADDTTIVDINFTLNKGGAIVGLIVSANDTTPIPNAFVEVYDSNIGYHERAYTNEHGEYKVEGLRSGKYIVQAIADGYFPEFYDGVRNRKEATPVEVVSPEVTTGIDFYLDKHRDRDGTIAGRVISEADESPLHGAVVIAVSPRKRHPYITFTGPQGHYRLTDLPAGTYYVYAWAIDFIGEFFDDAKLFRNADPVFVAPNHVAEGIDFALAPIQNRGIYAIRGKIRSSRNRSPIEGVLVNARLDNDVAVNAITDAEGNFIIDGLSAGEFKVEATGAGYADSYFGGSNEYNAANVSVGDGKDADNVEIEMQEDNVTSVESGASLLVPDKFDLQQNYPNPFNPETTIKYQLSETANVTIKIFNIIGQEIQSFMSKAQEAGIYTMTWDGKDKFGRQVSSGIYIYQLQAGDKFKMSRTMLLLK